MEPFKTILAGNEAYDWPTSRVIRRSTPERQHIMSGSLPQGSPDTTSLPPSCVQQNISFFDLSAELRNLIYETTLPSRDKGDQLVIACPSAKVVNGAQPNITRTCRQVRKESLAMFYAKNDFYAYIERHDFSLLTRAAKCITSGPTPPHIHIHMKLLHRFHCARGLYDLAKDWRALQSSTINIEISTCLVEGRKDPERCRLVSEIINLAERQANAGPTLDLSSSDAEVRCIIGTYCNRFEWEMAIFRTEMSCEQQPMCTCRVQGYGMTVYYSEGVATDLVLSGTFW